MKVLTLLFLLQIPTLSFSGETVVLHAYGDPIRVGAKVYTPTKNYFVGMQGDENFVQYYSLTGKACWASDTFKPEDGDPDAAVALTGDQFVVLARDEHWKNYEIKKVITQRNGVGSPYKALLIQDDGNLVVKDHNNQVRFAIGVGEPKECTNVDKEK